MYRDSFVTCPGCGASLGTEVAADVMRACDGCRGAWVPEAIVVEMVRRMTNNAELAPSFEERRRTTTRACPACGRTMLHGMLEAVPVERCEKGHGFWFDAAELETVLLLAGMRTT